MSKPIFDPVTNQWSNIASMHTIRESCGVAAMALSSQGGVRGTECLNVVERYDPGRNAWTNVAPTRSRRCGVSVAVVNGCLYAVGGRDGWLTWSTVERLDPRVGKWEDVCPMSTRRSHSGSAMFDGHLYIVGGQQGTTALSSGEKYNPVANAWIEVAALNNKENTHEMAKLKRFRSQMTLAVVNEKLYAVGDAYIEVYDKELNFWKNHINTKD
ncbi:kelch repeat protein, partial [Ostertagia ostertagi]